MSEALPDDVQNPLAPDHPDARFRVSPSTQGIPPAWEPVEHASPLQPPALERHIIEAARGLSPLADPPTLGPPALDQPELPEARNGITGTAERIGSAVGSAQRQVRRGLTLVSSGATHLSQIERERLHRAASTLQEIGGEVTGIRHEAARRLDQWSADTGGRLQQLRHDIVSAPSRLRLRGQQLAAQYPLQTIAAIAGVSFAVGVALRLSRRSRRG